MMNNGILNRSIQINFSETLQDIQSVGFDKLIAMISIYQDYDIENKQALLVSLLAENFKRTTLIIIPNQTLLW